MDVAELSTADACACFVTIASWNIKHFSVGLEVFAASKFQKNEVLGSYYGTLVHHDLSSRAHTKKVYGNGVLKVDVARISMYAMRV